MPAGPEGERERGGVVGIAPLLLLPPGVKVQEEVQPLPSFLRSEHTEPGAAAPPLQPVAYAWPEARAQPCCCRCRCYRRRRPSVVAAASTARLRDSALLRHRPPTPVRAPPPPLPPPPPSPFVSSAPAPPPRLALCRGRSARPQRAPGKDSERAPAPVETEEGRRAGGEERGAREIH
uniref:formin-like protein 10 n=1 Tax=Jaculus jaculus TaxID=51337 RepID=UPI001E1B04E6|nr:formin-like protein 10 [Jaculus jaculus]